MTVGELIKLLEKEDEKIQIVIARDAEGNSFRELADYSIEHWDEEDRCVGFCGDETGVGSHERLGMPAVICLWPY